MSDFLNGVIIGLGTGIAVFFGITVPFMLRRIANALEQIERREKRD